VETKSGLKFEFPLFAIESYYDSMQGVEYYFIAGGGGSLKSGITNEIVLLFEFLFSNF